MVDEKHSMLNLPDGWEVVSEGETHLGDRSWVPRLNKFVDAEPDRTVTDFVGVIRHETSGVE